MIPTLVLHMRKPRLRDWSDLPNITTIGFGFWTQACLIPSPVLLNKSLYIFNSFKFKMYKRQLSYCLVFWPLSVASLEKILPFLEFSFRVNSKHINCIGEYITFFHFSRFLLCSAFFYLTMDLDIFSQSIYRHFLFFYSCSLQGNSLPEHRWTLGHLADSKEEAHGWRYWWWRQATGLNINNNIKHLLCLYSGLGTVVKHFTWIASLTPPENPVRWYCHYPCLRINKWR